MKRSTKAICNSRTAGVGVFESFRLLVEQVPFLTPVSDTPFVFRPFILLVVLGCTAGIVGVMVNLRCLEFNAEAMVHSVFPGVVAGAVFGGMDWIIPGAAVAAVFVTIALVWVRHASEAGTAVVLTSFFAAGVVLSLKFGDRSGQLEALMFGRLLEVTEVRLRDALIVCALALILMVLTWQRQVFVAFDPHGARAAGINVLAMDICINVAIAAVVIAASSAIGVLLVIGYLVVPGAAARLLATNIRTMVPVAMGVGVFGGYLGLVALTLPGPISPQATVALSLCALYAVALLARELKVVSR
ncbi:metal ABC transporter permease [Corynebacterium canis]|uniref:Metal ABC transporter permease n=1 Tax=Corynebacterium canis TaxID=679663 RepID=A0A5C5UEH3_9CORY|nr:metal ABC transporter permease [Corynebacterium canis]WJY74353.1 Manganese transport system membrane protein MntB [Corynebacterium canis]